MSDDSYANTPESISELRANRSHNAVDWTPRDALISALRDIDSGKLDPSVIFIAVGTIREGATDTHYWAAGGNRYLVAGVAHRAIIMHQEQG